MLEDVKRLKNWDGLAMKKKLKFTKPFTNFFSLLSYNFEVKKTQSRTGFIYQLKMLLTGTHFLNGNL